MCDFSLGLESHSMHSKGPPAGWPQSAPKRAGPGAPTCPPARPVHAGRAPPRTREHTGCPRPSAVGPAHPVEGKPVSAAGCPWEQGASASLVGLLPRGLPAAAGARSPPRTAPRGADTEPEGRLDVTFPRQACMIDTGLFLRQQSTFQSFPRSSRRDESSNNLSCFYFKNTRMD